MSAAESKKKQSQTARNSMIAVLILALLIETGYLVYQNNQLKELKENSQEPKVLHQQTQTPISRPDVWEDESFTNPFHEMERMQSRLNKLLNRIRSQTSPLFHGMAPEHFDFFPAADLRETPSSYIVKMDLPGLEKDKIEVTVKGQQLTIKGERRSGSQTQDTQRGFFAQERQFGAFARSVTLPGPIKQSGMKATYEDGVLSVILPKAQNGGKDKKISVM